MLLVVDAPGAGASRSDGAPPLHGTFSAGINPAGVIVGFCRDLTMWVTAPARCGWLAWRRIPVGGPIDALDEVIKQKNWLELDTRVLTPTCSKFNMKVARDVYRNHPFYERAEQAAKLRQALKGVSIQPPSPEEDLR